jgi:signal transduction histidine kinase
MTSITFFRGIVGHAALMKMDPGVTKSQERRLKSIEELVQSAANLTSQLLVFAGLGRYEVGTLDINELLKKTSTMFGRTRKELMIHRELSKELMLVEADRTQMEQVFMNRFVNAWQAMPGGGDLYIKTTRTVVGDDEKGETFMKSGDYVKVSVTDSGEGMDEETKSRIFEPFSPPRKWDGDGGGLAMVYGIVKGHNGYIMFTVKRPWDDLHIYLPASEKQPVRVEETPRQEWLTGNETILVVDDEEHVVEVVEEF